MLHAGLKVPTTTQLFKIARTYSIPTGFKNTIHTTTGVF